MEVLTSSLVKVIGALNVMIQYGKRARPFGTHIEKLKPFVSDIMPTSWQQNDSEYVLQVCGRWKRLSKSIHSKPR